MKKILCVILILILMTGFVLADEGDTELEIHIASGNEKIRNNEKLYDENCYPGSFDVSYIGMDKETNGPVFHVQFISNEFYSSNSDWINRFDVTSYINGTVVYSSRTEDHTKIISERSDENSNTWQTVLVDYYAVFDNPENLAIDNTYSFALTRFSQRGYIMFGINQIDFSISYDPENLDSESKEDTGFTEIDDTSDKNNAQNNRNTKIYLLIGGLTGGGGALLLLRRRKKIKLKREKPIKQIVKKTNKKPTFVEKVINLAKNTGDLAIKGLKKVSTTISGTYKSIKKIGIDTKLGRIDVGDIIGFTGADEIMKITNTISDLCDVIDKKKDLGKVWKNVVDRLIDSKLGKLKKLIGKGIKINPKTLQKLININKEYNTVKGLVKDGISANEILDLKEKLASYKKGSTKVEVYNKKIETSYIRFEKGANIEGNNFKKILRGE